MKVAVGCDPNATEMKCEISEEIRAMGHDVTDFGSDDPVYANVAFEVGRAVSQGVADRGIVLCGTGIGVSIAANKVQGVRCALVTNHYQAERAALSNNANIIAMGAQVTSPFLARQFVRVWLESADKFDPGGRSGPKMRRIDEFDLDSHGHKDSTTSL